MNARGRRYSRHRGTYPSWWARHGKWLLPLMAVIVLTTAGVVAFTVSPGPSPPQHHFASVPPIQATRNSSRPPPAAEPPPASTLPPDGTGLVAEFGQWQAGLHAKAGVALRAIGAGSQPSVVFGDWSPRKATAWSTIKVPLVIAGMREQKISQPTQTMTAAITESDNAAAESIWQGLGDPATAATRVGEILHQNGDPTNVESRKLRPEFTAFGQTDWPLSNQTVFLAAAACDPHNQPVLELMRNVESDQKWGLGTVPGAEIKGGWGPSLEGRYLARQIAILPTSHGLTAVAIAAEPDSGSFADGTRDLDEIAKWLQDHLDALPAGRCNA